MRLLGAREPVDHSTAGAALVMKLARGDDRIIAELIAYAIAGHHAGLPDKHGESLSTLGERLKSFDPASIDTAWEGEVAADATGLLPKLHWQPDGQRAAFQLALLGRMLFSCLIDADFKDTERFYGSIEGRFLDREWPRLADILPGLHARYEEHMGRNALDSHNKLSKECGKGNIS